MHRLGLIMTLQERQIISRKYADKYPVVEQTTAASSPMKEQEHRIIYVLT